MKIVHLAKDEKFLPLARSLFEEAFPGANTFVVRQRSGRVPTFLKPGPKVRYRRGIFFRLPWLMPELWGADVAVIHSMTKHHACAVRGLPKRTLVVWIGYGYDYYGLLSNRIGGYWFDRTEALMKKMGILERHLDTMRSHVALVAHRINVFSVNPSETDMVRAALPQLNATYHALPSFTVEDIFAQGDARMSGPDVLLGQSSSPHNNHLEMFEVLRDTLPAAARLIVPLSYGDSRYADHVEQVGRTLFGDRFIAMRNWMPIAEYQQKISSCGFVVMNHRRQKAVGNISSGLYRGAKVFLQRTNPLFGFFTELGAVVFPVDMLSTDPDAAWQPLSAELQQANRQAIEHRFGRTQVLARIRALEGFLAQHRQAA